MSINQIKDKLIQKLLDYRSKKNMKIERSIKRADGPIRVGFLCQYISSWNKHQKIYEMMCEDDRFEPYIICVPMGIQNTELVEPTSLCNETYDYFISRGYSAINALVSENTWFDLKSLRLEYVFYPRPYNAYLPKPYSSAVVNSYARVCCINYGITLFRNVQEAVLNRDFFRNVYFFFADTPDTKEYVEQMFLKEHLRGKRKTLYLGFPSLQRVAEAKNDTNTAWDFFDGSFRLMWTPRWTSEPALGGTSFFKYKDAMIKMAKDNRDVSFLYRPHPLMFDNFIRTQEMTEEEVKEFKSTVTQNDNISFDDEPDYSATFWNTNVLVSDISGMLPEFYITGKPIIYCEPEIPIDTTDMMNEMLKGCYVVRNSDDLSSCMAMLKKGEDPLLEIRNEICKQLFPNVEGICNRIISQLILCRNI